MSKKQNIFFDWHGVLELGSFHTIREKLVSAFPCRLGLRDEIQKRGRSFASGNMTSESFWSELAMLTSVEASAAAKRERFRVQPRQDLWDLLPELADAHNLYVLSDCPGDKAEFIESHYDLSLFKKVFWSYNYGTTKREGKVFLDVLKELVIDPLDALVIDDSKTKIDIAADLGLNVILFTDTTDLSTLIKE